MKLEHQVCNLEISKRLKELGVKQESLFYWGHNQENFRHCIIWSKEWLVDSGITLLWGGFSAFTVAELGKIIIPNYKKLEKCEKFVPQNDKDFVRCLFSADYYGKVLIYLLENKLITL